MIDSKLQIRHTEDGRVVYLFNGKAVFDGAVPWELADLIAKYSTICARKAEEICKANQIVYDNAIIQRSGLLPGIGLSDNPKIINATLTEALHSRELRRAMPYQKHSDGMGNIQSKGIVGTPTIRKGRSNANLQGS